MGRVLAWLVLSLGLAWGLGGPMINIPVGQRVDGDLSTYTDDIRVDGEVTGSVTSWSGNITINGNVGGDVVSYTGDVQLLSNAQVAGSTMTLSGKLQTSTTGQVEGAAIDGLGVGKIVRPVVGIFTTSRPATAGISTLFLIALSSIFGALVLAAVLTIVGVWPQRSRAAAHMLQRMPGRSLLLGVLFALAVLALAPLALGALMSTVIGLPVAIILLIAVNLLFVYGLAVLIQAARTTLERTTSIQALSPASAFLTTVIVLPIVLIGFIAPLSALVLFYLMASPGLGAALLSSQAGGRGLWLGAKV